MKKILRTIGALLLVTALVISLIPSKDAEAKTSASDFEVDGNKLVKYSGTSEIVSIPDDILFIGEEAFAGNDYVVKVTIGDNVKSIAYGAFSNCDSLRTVVIGNRVENIDQAAFANDKALENITIGNSVKDLGSGVFAGDINLKNFVLSEGNTHLILKDNVLYDSKMEKLFCMLPTYTNGEYEMPNSVIEINGYAFWGNQSIKNVYTSSNLSFIPEYAFSNCSSLKMVKIPLPVHSIDAKAFEDCSNLSLVKLPDSLTNVNDTAFDGCPRVTFQATPGTYSYSFAQDFKKSEIAKVEYEDVDESKVVTKETVSTIIPIIDDNNVYEVVEGAPTKEPQYKDGVINGSDITGNTSNETYVSPNEYGRAPIVKGRAIVFIENKPRVIDGADYSDNIQVDLSEAENTPVTIDDEGNEVKVETVSTVLADNAQKGKDFPKFTVVADRIAEQAYYQDDTLTEYDIPEDITVIGDFAFARSALTHIDIPEGVTTIGYAAFYHCDNLESVTIPSSVKSISAYAFSNTPFLDNNKDEFVIIGDGILIAYNGNDSLVTIPEGVKVIADGTFKGRQGISAVNLSDTLEIIGEDAFNGCTNLRTVNRGENVIKIGANAFKGTPLSNVTIYPSVKEIGLGAFDLQGGTDTVTFLGDELPVIIDGYASRRIANVEDRTYVFGNIKNAIVSQNVSSFAGTVLEPGKYGFKGIVTNEFGKVVLDNSQGVTLITSPGIALSLNSALFMADANIRASIAGDEGTYILHITDSQNAKERIAVAYGDLYGGREPENLVGFDLSLYDASDSIKITKLGKQVVKVCLQLPANVSTDNLHMVALDSDGQLEAVEFSITETDGQKYIEFECTHFSPYGFYNYAGSNGNVDKDGVRIKDDTPDTGDYSINPKWFLVIFCIASSIALFLYSAKRDINE